MSESSEMSRLLLRGAIAQYYAAFIAPADHEAQRRIVQEIHDMSDDEYADWTQRLSAAMKDLGCVECGCEVYGDHSTS